MKIKQNYSSLYLISPSINIVNTKKHREIIGLEYTPRLVSHSPIHEHIVYIYNIYTSIGGTRVPSFSELTHRSSSSRLCLDTKSASNTSTSRYIRYIDCERTQKIYLAWKHVRERAMAEGGGEGGRGGRRIGIAGGADSAVPCKRKPTSWLSSYLR